MTDHNNGGQAFPTHPILYGSADQHLAQGMSLRDWFAAEALASVGGVDPRLPGDPPQHDYVWPTPEKLAERRATWAYLQADAMLAARNSTPTKGA